MKINFKVVIALLLIVAIAYFAFNAVQKETVSGTELSFVTSGVAVVNATEPVSLLAVSPRTFTLTSTDTDLGTIRPAREGSGRDLRYIVDMELGQGRTQLQVTRGADINFTLSGSETINVTLAARDDDGNRNILIGAAIASLLLLAYSGYSTRDTWMGMIRKNRSTTAPSMGTA
jgi:hypothetical protein